MHFAGHGFFADPAANALLSGSYSGDATQAGFFLNRNQLLLSGLVLGPAPNSSVSSSILTAEEVGSLDLRGTDLVVLSACETGLGQTAGGEGVLGLKRAFLTAGARTVVSSLWTVDDAATSLLMEDFYRNLLDKKQSKGLALRNAQLAILNSETRVRQRGQLLAQGGIPQRGIRTGETRQILAGNTSRVHPALWASFVLSGDGADPATTTTPCRESRVWNRESDEADHPWSAKRTDRTRRYAFSLVELLVAIALIGILTSLLLPAVQAAREAARRQECANNLRQLPLAAHNFEDAHRHLPAGLDVQHVGPVVHLLPYLEQSAYHEGFSFDKRFVYWWLNPVNRPPLVGPPWIYPPAPRPPARYGAEGRLNVLLCPAGPSPETIQMPLLTVTRGVPGKDFTPGLPTDWQLYSGAPDRP